MSGLDSFTARRSSEVGYRFLADFIHLNFITLCIAYFSICHILEFFFFFNVYCGIVKTEEDQLLFDPAIKSIIEPNSINLSVLVNFFLESLSTNSTGLETVPPGRRFIDFTKQKKFLEDMLFRAVEEYYGVNESSILQRDYSNDSDLEGKFFFEFCTFFSYSPGHEKSFEDKVSIDKIEESALEEVAGNSFYFFYQASEYFSEQVYLGIYC